MYVTRSRQRFYRDVLKTLLASYELYRHRLRCQQYRILVVCVIVNMVAQCALAFEIDSPAIYNWVFHEISWAEQKMLENKWTRSLTQSGRTRYISVRIALSLRERDLARVNACLRRRYKLYGLHRMHLTPRTTNHQPIPDECKICYDGKRDPMKTWGCGHMVCGRCKSQLFVCPFCRHA